MSTFRNVPTPLLSRMSEFLGKEDFASLYALTLTSKAFRSFFQPDLDKPTKIFKELAQHIVRGEKKELEQKLQTLYEKKPALLQTCLKSRILVQDFSGRRIEGTPLQLCLGAVDVSRSISPQEGMLFSVITFLKEFPNADAEIKKQVIQQFPLGWKEQWKERVQRDSAALHKVVKAIKDAPEVETKSLKEGFDILVKSCEPALNEFREYLNSTIRETIKTGKHFNMFLFIEAWSLDADISVNFHPAKRLLFWRSVMGYIERFLPACEILTIIDPNLSNRSSLVRCPFEISFPIMDPRAESRKTVFFPLPDAKSGAGFDYAFDPFGGRLIDESAPESRWSETPLMSYMKFSVFATYPMSFLVKKEEAFEFFIKNYRLIDPEQPDPPVHFRSRGWGRRSAIARR